MRRDILIFLLVTIFSIDGFAQKARLGINMGPNFCNLVGRDKIDDSKPRIGFYGGLNVDIPLAYDAFLQIGAYYSQQGVKVETDEFVNNDSLNTSHYIYSEYKYVDYLHIPIFWKQTFGDVYTKVGPYAAMPIRTKSEYKKKWENRDTIIVHTDTLKAFINNLRRYDVGAAFAVGFQTSISRGLDLFFDASYRIGFFSVEQTSETSKKIIRNQCFCVSAGVYFVQRRGSRTYRHH